jgi:uncharacterized membrane protein
MQPAAAGGIDKKTGSWLSYLLGWLTGVILLYVGKNDPDVKYHAAQSIIFFGSATVLEVIISILSSFAHWLQVLYWLVVLASFIGWVIALVKAFGGNGQRFELPLVGSVIRPYAEQLAASVK